ncbi:MAG: phosphatidylserine decarboxylase [Planctomycetota bacterium]|jgi:phosphatidylserine decarboxylase
MRIPLTKYGWPQVVTFPAIVAIAMLIALLAWPQYWSAWGLALLEACLAIVLLWILSFFRDPQRAVPADKNILLAPADGTVTDIELVAEDDFVAGTALRIGIFLSIFDTHINRAPCNAKVERIDYRPGKYRNAMNPQSGRVNESSDLALVRTDHPQDRLIIRQISGAIARRIVCATSQGQNLTGGEKFGMIKFGSRTELYLPPRENAKCLVRVGDKVKAGLSPLIRYE